MTHQRQEASVSNEFGVKLLERCYSVHCNTTSRHTHTSLSQYTGTI